ncbi:MAG: hypothetical protein COA33_000635 [Fluviicola sp.]|nr:hypothetical protein [Fluviicola sp.]
MKTKNIFLLLITLGVFTFSACKKDKLLPPESTDPVFMASGNFGAQSFSVVAGDDDAYMYTMTNVVYGVEVASGELANNNFGIELGIYNGQIDKMNADFESGMSLTPTFSEKMTTPITTLSANYFSNSTFIQSIDWVVDGMSLGVTVPIMNPGHYNVTANISYMDGSSASLTNDLILGYERSVNEPLNYLEYSDSTASLWIPMGNVPIQSVTWYLNNVLLPQVADSIGIDILGGINEIRAEIIYTNGATRTRSVLVDSSPNYLRSIEDFTFFEESSVNILQDFNILVKLTSNGMIYESELADNSASTIQINSFEYYGLNNAGNKVYKVDADVSCKVRSAAGGVDIPLSFSTIFGFEVK